MSFLSFAEILDPLAEAAVNPIVPVWKLPRPEPNRVTCLSFIEQALSADEPGHAFARVAPLIRGAIARF